MSFSEKLNVFIIFICFVLALLMPFVFKDEIHMKHESIISIGIRGDLNREESKNESSFDI